MALSPSSLVAFGASAGGLEVFTKLGRSLNPNSGNIYVFLQHFDPTKKSTLAKLLQKSALLPVVEISQGLEAKPDTIYVAPAGSLCAWKSGAFCLTKISAKAESTHNFDFFLQSLSKSTGFSRTAVVLGGQNSDGKIGCMALRRSGGKILAQDPLSTKFPYMPLAVINADLVDQVASPKKIADLCNSGKLGKIPGDGFLSILQFLFTQTGVNFSHYKQPTLRRRLERRMRAGKFTSEAAYLAALKTDPRERKQLFEEITIHVTDFFRDQDVFQELQRSVLPKILKGRSSRSPVRVWVPACSTGQEAYSFGILITEALRNRKDAPLVQIFATDVSEDVIRRSRKGYFSSVELESVPPKLRRRYFVPKGDGFEASKALRNICVFARHDLTADTSFSRMDLISCRNLFIYFTPHFQEKALGTLAHALVPGGFLILGSAESAALAPGQFNVVDRRRRFFQKPLVKKAKAQNKPRNTYPALEIPALSDKMQAYRDQLERGRPLLDPKLTKLQQKSAIVAQLQKELQLSFSHFEELFESQSALHEELQATHEEVLANNEELQTSNEEMEILQEELQAANEELATVNDEMVERNEDLLKLNAKLSQAKRRALGAEQYAKSIVESVNQPLLELDENLSVRAANSAYYASFGASAERTLGLPMEGIGEGQWRNQKLRKLLLEILPEKSEVKNFEVDFDYPKIGRKVTLLNAKQILFPSLKSKRILISFQDISGFRESERETRSELGRVVSERNEAREDISDLELEKTLRERFVATLSHDLRNPLTAARISAQMIARAPQNIEKTAQFASRVVNSLTRADMMITNLLDANRIEAGEPLVVEMQEFSLSELAEEVVSEQASQHGDRFDLKVPAHLIVNWNRDSIRRVLENLVSNAVKYGKQRSPIEIKASISKKKCVCLEVKNQNAHHALTKAEQAKIFAPFGRTESAVQGTVHGWGLGLTLVRGLAEAHKGEANVRSSEEEGTVFSVLIPQNPAL